MTRTRATRPQVFINAPFDSKYTSIFRAIVFTALACGYQPRCGLESNDSGTTRIRRLCRIIAESDISIHDLSRTQTDRKTGFPRFNMPFELGLVIGARELGSGSLRDRHCLVLATHRFEYQSYISDIAGQDISMHNDSAEIAISRVREFLRGLADHIPGSNRLVEQFRDFIHDLPKLAKKPPFYYDLDDLHYRDLCTLVEAYLVARGSHILGERANH